MLKMCGVTESFVLIFIISGRYSVFGQGFHHAPNQTVLPPSYPVQEPPAPMQSYPYGYYPYYYYYPPPPPNWWQTHHPASQAVPPHPSQAYPQRLPAGPSVHNPMVMPNPGPIYEAPKPPMVYEPVPVPEQHPIHPYPIPPRKEEPIKMAPSQTESSGPAVPIAPVYVAPPPPPLQENHLPEVIQFRTKLEEERPLGRASTVTKEDKDLTISSQSTSDTKKNEEKADTKSESVAPSPFKDASSSSTKEEKADMQSSLSSSLSELKKTEAEAPSKSETSPFNLLERSSARRNEELSVLSLSAFKSTLQKNLISGLASKSNPFFSYFFHGDSTNCYYHGFHPVEDDDDHYIICVPNGEKSYHAIYTKCPEGLKFSRTFRRCETKAMMEKEYQIRKEHHTQGHKSNAQFAKVYHDPPSTTTNEPIYFIPTYPTTTEPPFYYPTESQYSANYPANTYSKYSSTERSIPPAPPSYEASTAGSYHTPPRVVTYPQYTTTKEPAQGQEQVHKPSEVLELRRLDQDLALPEENHNAK